AAPGRGRRRRHHRGGRLMAGTHQIFLKGQTSQFLEVLLRDATTGQGKPSVAAASVSVHYTREGAAVGTALTPTSGTLGAWASGTWAEFTADAGLYQFGIPNAALAAGADGVTFTFRASGC